MSALALAIGPVVGGALTEYVSWRAIFFLNLPVAVGAVVVTLFAARESRDETTRHTIDWPGIVDALDRPDGARARPDRGQLVGLGLARDRGPARDRRRGLGAFVAIERRVRSRWWTSRSSARARSWARTLVAFIVSFAMLAMFFFMALYMQNILGY